MIVVQSFLKKLFRVAAREEARYSMTGIKVNEFQDSNGCMEYQLTATDGRVLLTVRGYSEENAMFPVRQAEGEHFYEYVVPCEAWAKGFDKSKRGGIYPLAIQAFKGDVEVKEDNTIKIVEREQILLQSGDVSQTVLPVEGRFPDWKQVLPRRIPQARFSVSPRLFAELLLVMADVIEGADGPGGVEILYFGPGQPIGLASSVRGFILDGLIMPLSSDIPQPAPVKDTEPPAPEVIDSVNQVVSEMEPHTTNGHSPHPEPSEEPPTPKNRLPRGKGKGKKE